MSTCGVASEDPHLLVKLQVENQPCVWCGGAFGTYVAEEPFFSCGCIELHLVACPMKLGPCSPGLITSHNAALVFGWNLDVIDVLMHFDALQHRQRQSLRALRLCFEWQERCLSHVLLRSLRGGDPPEIRIDSPDLAVAGCGCDTRSARLGNQSRSPSPLQWHDRARWRLLGS